MNKAAPPFYSPPRDPRLADFLQDYPSSLFSERLYQSIELMERYSIDLAADLLGTLDLFEHLSQWRSASELCQTLSFKPRFRFAVAWLLDRLVETGCIEARTEENTRQYQVRTSPWQSDLGHLRSIGLQIDPGNAPTLDLLDKAASLYPAVARGEQSGEEALFGTQGIPGWLAYFSNENPTYAINNWVGATAVCARIKEKAKLRILEVGAGAGSGSQILLHCLSECNLLPRLEHYLVTEPNGFFLRRAQRDLAKRYPDLPLEWRALDINRTWSDQGIVLREFDLIYAVNVIHVAKDLLFSLDQAHAMLGEEGWLVIGECVRPRPCQPIYIELIFQLLDSFTDVLTDPEIRPNPGFLTIGQWRRAFTRACFNRTEVTPDIDRISEVYPHFFTAAVCGQST